MACTLNAESRTAVVVTISCYLHCGEPDAQYQARYTMPAASDRSGVAARLAYLAHQELAAYKGLGRVTAFADGLEVSVCAPV